MVSNSSESEERQHVAGSMTTEADGAAGDVQPAVMEPKLDPELEKYMKIVQQKREQEKQVLPALYVSKWSVYVLHSHNEFRK